MEKRIYLKRNMPDIGLIKQFENIPASNVSDVMEQNCAMHPRIKLLSAPLKQTVCGPAYTVKCGKGDNLMLNAALNYCLPGDVLVVSNDGGDTRALIGEILTTYLKYQKKAAGIIVDGPIRDIDAISKSDFPVYAAGTTPCGPHKDGPGEINVPISCGGVTVNPGDIIVADADGVVVIPLHHAEKVVKDAKKLNEQDEKRLKAAKDGTADRSWVDKILAEKGYEIIDDVYCK